MAGKSGGRGRARRPGREGAEAREASPYFNRELSWLAFNERVLEEALDAENPLLERLNFLSIVGSNLDEFFMVRVGGLRQLARAGSLARCPAGLTPGEQLEAISRKAHAMVARQYRCLGEVLSALPRKGVEVLRGAALERKVAASAERWFEEEVFPALTPLAVEDGPAFPEVAGLSVHLAVRLRRPGAGREDAPLLALVELPRGLPRFRDVPAPGVHRFVLAEDIIRLNLDRLFEGHEVLEAAAFRLTRDADLPVDDEEVEDVLEAMEEILKARRQGAPVRMEIEAHASKGLVDQLSKAFGLGPSELFRVDGPVDLKPFMRLAGQVEGRSLRYPRFDPQPVAAFEERDSVWEAIRDRDVLLHLPYDSFRPVIDLLDAAADDPQVVAIKQTLYRTSDSSPIIAALERAARNGKQVTVLVELKARFDEARNIGWALRLSEAGAQVVYGVVGLKTHAKILMIVRREADGVRRYLHLSTGNYNEVTARRYEDVGLFTCEPDFGTDAANLFNAVTGYSEPRGWRQLVVAPTGLRERLIQLIDREIERSSPEDPGLLMLKMNSLADAEMIDRLCLASRSNVRVRLCVRGICCLRPGVPGLSENVEVVSIVDRFLEHSRIYYFRNGGQEEVYLASADFMPRNLNRRLEVMFPVRDPAHRERLTGVLKTALSDTARGRRLRPDGTWVREPAAGEEPPLRAQVRFMEEAISRAEALRIQRLTVFRPRGPGTAPGLR